MVIALSSADAAVEVNRQPCSGGEPGCKLGDAEPINPVVYLLGPDVGASLDL
jgi:hypothetical protein